MIAALYVLLLINYIGLGVVFGYVLAYQNIVDFIMVGVHILIAIGVSTAIEKARDEN